MAELSDKQCEALARGRAKADQMRIGAKWESGLARVRKMERMTAEDVVRAISGHACGRLRLDKERLMSLRLLGEYHGLWGTGRKPPATGHEDEPEGFKVKPRNLGKPGE